MLSKLITDTKINCFVSSLHECLLPKIFVHPDFCSVTVRIEFVMTQKNLRIFRQMPESNTLDHTTVVEVIFFS